MRKWVQPNGISVISSSGSSVRTGLVGMVPVLPPYAFHSLTFLAFTFNTTGGWFFWNGILPIICYNTLTSPSFARA